MAYQPSSLPGSVVKVECGWDIGCALLDDGTIHCWCVRKASASATRHAPSADQTRVCKGAASRWVNLVAHRAPHRGWLPGGDYQLASLQSQGPYVDFSMGEGYWICGKRANGTYKCTGHAVTGADEAWMANATAIRGFGTNHRCKIVNNAGSCVGTYENNVPVPTSLGNVIAVSSDLSATCFISGPHGARKVQTRS